MTTRIDVPIVLPTVEMTVTESRLRFFAKAIGESARVYTDESVANCAGHPRLPAPPTFLFSVELECPDPFAWLTVVGVDRTRVLHGEQAFRYHLPAYAGDTLIARPRIVAHYPKTDRLEILKKDTEIERLDGTAIASLSSTYLVLKDI